MRLSSFLPQLTDDIRFEKMSDDSRQIGRGDVFVFDARIAPNGGRFIEAALAAGAAAVVTNIKHSGTIYHPAPNQVLAAYAKQIYPAQPAQLVGVTGTNGKTSVAWFYAQLMAAAGISGGSIGTLGVWAGNKKVLETGFTAPTPLKFHESLAMLAQHKVAAACVEASSHALALNRLDGVRFAAAALTNITPDHLDFHGDMTNYASAKQRLFSDLLVEDGIAVLPTQRPEALPIAAWCKEHGCGLITFGSANAELVIAVREERANGMTCDFKYQDTQQTLKLPLLGAFQASNVAAAMSLALASGAPLAKLLTATGTLKPAPGRMEIFTASNTPTAVVDYAHTPDALEQALRALRPLTVGKLHVVFGCGGDRDATKRAPMGAIAAKLADNVWITDDNPRTEDAAAIRAQIKTGAPNARESGDRAEAIAEALAAAAPEDVVLVAGKGHETGQIIGKDKIPFDDRTTVRDLVTKKGN